MKQKELDKKIESYYKRLGIEDNPHARLMVHYAIRYGYKLGKKEKMSATPV